MDGVASVFVKWVTEANRIEVPFFQRPYVWDDDDFEALLDSFLEAPDNTMPFFGSVIVKRIGKEEEANYLIIDGQQRITTFNVLIRTLLDLNVNGDLKLSATTLQTLRNAVYDIECDDEDNEHFSTRLIPSNSDKVAFDKIMDNDLKRPLDMDSLADTPIEHAYRFFYSYFAKAGADIAKRIGLKFNNHNKSMIFIILDDKDDEQKIFDSVNSLGKALTNSDIIKNYIFQKMKEYAKGDQYKENNIIKVYNKYWDSIFYGDDDKKNFWYSEFTVGRITTDHLECFLKDLAVIKKIYAAKKNTGTYGLCNTYKKYIDGLDYEALEEFIKEINEYAQVYYKYKTEYLCLSNFVWTDYKNRLLLILDYLETSTFNPYILKLLKDNGPDIENRFYNFERFFLQRFVFGGKTKNYNQCCEGLISAIDDKIYFADYMKESPTDTRDYRDKLRKCTNKQGLLLIFLIEMMNRDGNEEKYSDALNIKAYTLEHVMPQKWSSNDDWLKTDSYSEDGTLLDKNNPNFIDNRNEAVRSIGNFALLTAKLNTSISNGSFEVKVNGNGKKNGSGMKQFAANLITTQNIISIYNQTKTWDERNIFEKEKEYYNKLNDFYKWEP